MYMMKSRTLYEQTTQTESWPGSQGKSSLGSVKRGADQRDFNEELSLSCKNLVKNGVTYMLVIS